MTARIISIVLVVLTASRAYAEDDKKAEAEKYFRAGEALYKNAAEATENLNKATVELNKLLVDFQAHPRKYINLKIF